MDQPLGPILDALDVVVDLDEHERLTDVVVLGKVTKFDASDGATRILIASTPETDWITRLGLIYAGRSVIDGNIERVDDDP